MKSLLLAAMLVLALPVSAQNIELNYSGSVTELVYADCQSLSAFGSCNSWSFASLSETNFLNGLSISVGDEFIGQFIYDTSAPRTAISNDGYQAIHLNGVTSSSLQIGDISLPATWLPYTKSGSYSIINDRNGYDAFYLQGIYSGTDWFTSTNLSLQDSSGTVYSGFDVPHSIDYSRFNANIFNLGFLRRSDGDQVQLYGSLNSAVIVTPVPELESFALMMTGMVVLAGRIRSIGNRRKL